VTATRSTPAGLACFLLFGLIPPQAHALELWLARGFECTSCTLYQRAADTRGYGFALHHAGRDIPILSIDKNIIATDILAQIPENIGPESSDWATTLTVLVMDVGRVVFAGNIEESTDTNELRYPDAVMFPPHEPAANDAALRLDDPRDAFFERRLNLEYFADVALGRAPQRIAAGPVSLQSPQPAAIGPRNVILWGAAATPLQLAQTVPAQIADLRASLERAELGTVRYLTLYGHGSAGDELDTSQLVEGRVTFARADPPADLPADAASLDAALTAVRERRGARSLLVQVGQSEPAGAPLWGHALSLRPRDLERIREESPDAMIMVSGTCHGGQFATALQCGFFAAHPESAASACSLNPHAAFSSDDYLHHFFTTATRTTTQRRTRQMATLYDAHWYASTRIANHRLSYSTTDALIDAYFESHPGQLPESLTVAEIRAAASAISRAEADAIAELSAGLAPDLAIPLTGHVAASRAAAEEHATHRDGTVAVPYPLMLTQLARRIAYGRLQVSDGAFAAAERCERQSLEDFFQDAR
jgi:hypothetical protein